MKEVTDPNILKQLGTPVTDPNILAQLGNPVEDNQVPVQKTLPGTSSAIGGMPNPLHMLQNVAIGMGNLGQATANLPYNISNALMGHGIIPQGDWVRRLKAPDIDIGKTLGVPNPGILDKIEQLSPALMMPIGGGVVGGAAAGTLFGGENPFAGALVGGLLPVAGAKALEYIPQGISKVSSLISNMRGIPEKQALSVIDKQISGVKKIINQNNPAEEAEQAINSLGKGKTIEENAIQGIKEVQKGFLNSRLNYQKGIKPILDDFGKEGLEEGNFFYNLNKQTALKRLVEQQPDLESSLAYFKKSPTIENGLKLQSDLNKVSSNLFKKANISGDYLDYNILKNSRKILNDDIAGTLANASPKAAEQFSNLNNDYFNNVVSHYEDPVLSKIIEGKYNNFSERYSKEYRTLLKNENLTPKDINKFVNSGDVYGPAAEKALNSLFQSPLSESAIQNSPKLRQILAYHKIGGGKAIDPETFVKNVGTLENTAQNYVPKGFSNIKSSIQNKIDTNAFLQGKMNDFLSQKQELEKIIQDKAARLSKIPTKLLFGTGVLGGVSTIYHALK